MPVSEGHRRLAGQPAERLALLGGVAALAFLVRLLPVLRGGGLHTFGRYDDGVYYAAGAALTFGRLPYHDFVLLHPPGIALVLAPFALLGRLTSDPLGMSVARVSFMLLGALNAVLVAVIAARWGRAAALVSGVLYACWWSAVYAEQSTLLEPLGTVALLVALLLLLRREVSPSTRAQLLAGAVLGLGAAVKIWYLVAWGVIVLWQLVVRRPAEAARLVVGGVVALVVVVGPFLALAPTRMVDMVVRDQLLRTQTSTPRLPRVSDMLGLMPVPQTAGPLLVVVVALVFVLAAVLCLADPLARVVVALLAAHVIVLLVSPTYFEHYATLIAAPAALVLGIAAQRLAASRRSRWPGRVVVAGLVVAALGAGGLSAHVRQGKPFPGAALAAAAPPGCIAADTPEALIQMNRLSSDLRAGCRVEVDVTGITYDALARSGPQGHPLSRRANRDWQQYLYDYLTSGSAFVVARPSGDSLSPQTLRAVRMHPVLASARGLKLRQS